jgi:SAM-dependent methyltransferase
MHSETNELPEVASPRTSVPTDQTRTGAAIPLYDQYFAGQHKADWYAVGAVAKAQNVLDLCRGRTFRRIADIGAGNGEVTARLLDGGLGVEVTALEISQSGLEALRARFQGTSVACVAFDGYTIPFEADRFDLAVLSHVVEHVEHPRMLLHEVRRVARMAYIEVPFEHRRFRDTLSTPWVPDSTGHINYFDFGTAKRLLETSGWKVVASAVRNPVKEAFQYASGRRKGWLVWNCRERMLQLAPRIAQGIFCYHGCYLCERAPTVSESLV